MPGLREAWQSLQSGEGWAPGCRLAQPDAGFRTVQEFFCAIEQALSEALEPRMCRELGTADLCQQPLRRGLLTRPGRWSSEHPNVRESCMPLRRSLGPGWHAGKYPRLVLAVKAGEMPKAESAHRLVALMMTGPPKPHHHQQRNALHKPGCAARCMNPLHIRWGSAHHSARDRVDKLRHRRSRYNGKLRQDGSFPPRLEQMHVRAINSLYFRSLPSYRRKPRRNATALFLLEAKLVLEGKRQPKSSHQIEHLVQPCNL